ncbi:MAG: hypothetical protein HDR03_14975 [Lachnospiraceae bacterium]|nr:hypothetical protein [Lachnospiraceae bacterium]
MVKTVTLYKNTGITPSNVLDNKNILSAFETVTCPSIAIKQSRGLISIRVSQTYETIMSCDYAKIGEDDCYWITGINMLNDNVAELTLLYDVITSVGVQNIQVVSGWCVRRHVNNDELFDNTIDEPFVATESFKLDEGGMYPNPNTSEVPLSYVLSTVDLSEEVDTSKLYEWTQGESQEEDNPFGCFVPDIPKLTSFTKYKIPKAFFGGDEDNGVVNTGDITYAETVTPGTCLYSLENQTVRDSITTLLAVGAPNVILDSYTVPSEYGVGINADNPNDLLKVTEFPAVAYEFTSSLETEYGKELNIKNKKAYSGQFNKYTVLSICSGESCEFKVENIVDENNSVKYKCTADIRYNGKPWIFPAVYFKNNNVHMLGLVGGSVWQRAPLVTSSQTGVGMQSYMLERQRDMQGVSNVMNGIDSMLGLAGSLIGLGMSSNGVSVTGQAGGLYQQIQNPNGVTYQSQGSVNGGISAPRGVFGGLGSLYNQQIQNEMSYNQLKIASQTPNIMFGRVPSLQDIVGNVFYDYRIRLSDNDLVRFDNFLTQYGYAVNESLTSQVFSGRVNFNYVQAKDAVVKIDGDLSLENMVASTLNSGVRIWHVAPNNQAMTDNPIKEAA